MKKGGSLQARKVRGYSDRDKIAPSYWQLDDGTWNIFLPDERAKPEWDGFLGALGGHTVIEHEDGTITVTPSILITDGWTKCTRHGHLERGVWREV
jgi:hypothetical protein